MPKLECEVETVLTILPDCVPKTGFRWKVRVPPQARNQLPQFCAAEIATYNYEFAKFGAESEENSEVWCDAIMCVYQQGDRCLADRIKIKVVGGFPSEKETTPKSLIGRRNNVPNI